MKIPEWYQIIKLLADKSAFPHNLLLWGIKGAGKSTTAQRIFSDRRTAVIQCHSALQPQDWLWRESVRAGETVFAAAPALEVWAHGGVVILDEVDQFPYHECMSLIHSFLDSNVTGRIERPDGVVYRRGDDTIIIGTSNRSPGDLPETVSDRFELSLRVTSYSPDALETIVDPGLRELARRDARRASAELPPAAPAPPTLRAVQAADRLARRLGDRELALWLVFGSEAPEIESLLSSILTDVSSE